MISQDTMTVRIPMTIRRIGGRKQIIVPEGGGVPERSRAKPDEALLKALARAFKWKRMIETGQVRSLNELAEAEKLNGSYVSRIFRLTLLAPDIVEAILAGRQPRTLQLADLLEDVPVDWGEQRERFS
ncbi:putative bacteriophage-related protein [Rhodospirillaceae bacterium LM-1]|nr:putative bacteriophage-related protein [Rhodospirillaceae bacterium LM-1]